ncbi:MAG: NTP transferase domain-containing protein [Solirubrobacteraceae bacterium]
MIRGERGGVHDGPLVAVLAGGLGSRLGGGKPGAILEGRPLLAHPLAAAAAAGLQAVVVARADSALPTVEAPVLIEPPGVRHPLWGVAAALRAEGAERGVLALGCDMPFLEPALLAALAAHPAPTLAMALGGRLGPLPARYEAAQAGALEVAARAGRSMGEVLQELGATVLDEDWLRRFGDPARMLFSVNDAAGLERARRLAG